MSENKEVNQLENIQKQFYALKNEIAKVILGQDKVVEQLILSIFCRGHVLLVGVPELSEKSLLEAVIFQIIKNHFFLEIPFFKNPVKSKIELKIELKSSENRVKSS